MGDVTGHDISAASLMGQLRTATRTLATLDLPPAQILNRLDQITADLTDAETSATCIYATCDPATAEWEIARAGHPPPAIARPGHHTAYPRLPAGLPLGTGLAEGRYRATRLHLPPGSTLVLYTDGLIETPAADIDTGMARLARALATPAAPHPGLRQAAGHPRPQPGRRHGHPHGPNLIHCRNRPHPAPGTHSRPQHRPPRNPGSRPGGDHPARRGIGGVPLR